METLICSDVKTGRKTMINLKSRPFPTYTDTHTTAAAINLDGQANPSTINSPNPAIAAPASKKGDRFIYEPNVV
jgi:hypothetical protein